MFGKLYKRYTGCKILKGRQNLMRNLKKVLALVLALAMVMTMFAGAVSFTDKLGGYEDLSSAAAKDAADVLKALGVAKGDGEGNINGASILTRAEAAKLVYAATTGDVDGAAEYYNTASRYSDVAAGDWFADVVSWATANGILAGYGDGTVKPNAPVTGVELAKMLLVACGNDAVKNGLVGSAWADNTLTLAGKVGLLANVAGNLYQGLSRENAYVMTANAIKIALGAKAFNLLDCNAVLVANKNGHIDLSQYDDASLAATITGLCYNGYLTGNIAAFVYRDYDGASTLYGSFKYKVFLADVATSSWDLGTEYRILTTKVDNDLYSSDIRTVYGIIGESTNTHTVTNTTRAQQKLDGIKVGYLGATTLYFNGLTSLDTKNVSANTANSTAPVRYIDNNADGKVDTILVADYVLGNVAAVNDTTYTIVSGNKAADYKAGAYKITNADALAVGDYVAMYNVDGVMQIKKLSVVKGSVSAFDGTKYTINGTKYDLSSMKTARAESFLKDGLYQLSGVEYTFITDEDAKNAFIVDVMVNENTKYGDYALVAEISDIEASSFYYKPYVRLFTADNEFKVYTVASINGMTPYEYINLVGSQAADDDFFTGMLVSYVVSGNDVYLTTSDALYTKGTGLQETYFTDAKYSSAINMWVANGNLVDTDAAVVFAIASLRDTASWKAYAKNEFYGADITAKALDVVGRQITGYNGAIIAEVAVALLDADDIPGTVLGANGSIILSNTTGATGYAYDAATKAYTYTIATVPAFGQTAETFTYKSYSPVASEFVKGQAYKVNLDAEGFIQTITPIKLTDDTFEIASYIPTELDTVVGYYVKIDGTRVLKLAKAEEVELADDAIIYTVKNLASTDADYPFGTINYYDLFQANGGINVLGKEVTISAIYNLEGDISVAFISLVEKK